MSRHAYLIMAHHRPDLLQLLINALDDTRNDLFIHIDKKSSMNENMFACQHSRLYFIPRMSVAWGGYSQVECVYALLRFALDTSTYEYYHLLTGVNYPLWNQDYIHAFFDNNKGKEFVGFDNSFDCKERLRYYVAFAEFGKLTGMRGKVVQILRYIHKKIQILFASDRTKNSDLVFKKGCAYFSITEELVKKVLEEENKLKPFLLHTISSDEVFMQTIVFNSRFKDSLYNLEDEYDGCMRELAWPSNLGEVRSGCNFIDDDLMYLINSKRLFAMKFESPCGISLINDIKKIRNIK